LFFPKVKGLDGQKVGVVLETDNGKWTPGKTLNRDYAIFETRSQSGGEPIPEPVVKLKEWWDTTGEPNKEVDHDPVKAAGIYGGRMALKWTAAVPATMFFGYLMLVFYFKSQGGYKTVEIDETGETHLTDHKPTAEEAFEDGEEAPTSGQA